MISEEAKNNGFCRFAAATGFCFILSLGRKNDFFSGPIKNVIIFATVVYIIFLFLILFFYHRVPLEVETKKLFAF